jgi:hypothetical protein
MASAAARTGLAVLPFLALPIAVSADGPHLRGDGLSFPAPLPALGEALELVGRLDADECEPPFAMDPVANEYTWTVYGPVVHAIEEPTVGIRTLHLTVGIFELREDFRRNSTYLADPPNSAVPSTFHDGDTLLLGIVSDLLIREIFGIVTATGDLTFQAGSALPDLGPDVNWTLAAGISPFDGELPAGYGSRWSIELTPRAPVGTESSTWGGIKALYR